MIKMCKYFDGVIDNARCAGIYCKSSIDSRVNDFKAGKHSRDNHIIFFCECDYWDCEIYKVLDGSEVNAKSRNY